MTFLCLLRCLFMALFVTELRAFTIQSRSSCSSIVTICLQQRTPVALAAAPATLEPPVQKEKVEKKEESDSVTRKGGWAVRLFNDPMNKREFVAACLSKICGLSDGQSYSVMMQAHQNGVAVVGRYDLERAECFRNALIEHGLLSDMIPVEED